MKSIGNKLIILAFGLATASMTLQAAEEPKLIKFEPHTPAKAQQVNSNFNEVKRYTKQTAAELAQALDALQTRVAELEAADPSQDISEIQNAITLLQGRVAELENNSTKEEYTIPVWGDCVGECGEENLIGYAKSIPNIIGQNRVGLPIKANLGLLALKKNFNSGQYQFLSMDKDTFQKGSEIQVYYSQDDCTGDAYITTGSILITSTDNKALETVVFEDDWSNPFILEKDAELQNLNGEYYWGNSAESCLGSTFDNRQAFSVGAVSIEKHNIKPAYTSIHIDGYQLH